MSLTDHLKSKSSPIRQFFLDQFPNTRSFLADARKRVREASTVRPDADVQWSTIGMALDYRVRYYFGVTPHDKLIAYEGARCLTDAQPVGSSGPLGFSWAGSVNEAVIIFDKCTGKKVFTYFPDKEWRTWREWNRRLTDVPSF